MDDFYALLFLAYAMCMLLYSSYYILMVFTQQENHREWKILPHNAKGINSQEKWNCLRNKVKDTRCSIIYIQETKILTSESFAVGFSITFMSTPNLGLLGVS